MLSFEFTAQGAAGRARMHMQQPPCWFWPLSKYSVLTPLMGPKDSVYEWSSSGEQAVVY